METRVRRIFPRFLLLKGEGKGGPFFYASSSEGETSQCIEAINLTLNGSIIIVKFLAI